MTNIIDELKNEHKIIISHLESFNENYRISPETARRKFFLAKEIVLKHFKKENEIIYSALDRESKKNTQLKSYLDIFPLEPGKTTILVSRFFEKYENQVSADFVNDFDKINFHLKQRMGVEERVLYKEYEKINIGSELNVIYKRL